MEFILHQVRDACRVEYLSDKDIGRLKSSRVKQKQNLFITNTDYKYRR